MKRKRSVAAVFWLLAAVLGAGFAWFWWHRQGGLGPSAGFIPAPTPAKPVAQPAKADTNTPSVSQIRTESTRPAVARLQPATNATIVAQTNLPSERIKRTAPALTNAFTVSLTATNFPRAVQNTLELQVALARQALSPGSLDGFIGNQTRAALKCFQQKEHLPTTGELDHATRARLMLSSTLLTSYVVTSNDLAALQTLSATWLGKSQQSALGYESILELVAEKGRASPSLIRRLNPTVEWTNIIGGANLEIPDVNPPAPTEHAAFLTIQLGDKALEAWDENTNLLAHFPCSIARRVEKRPVGELHVAVIAQNPNYTMDPENFPESAEARELQTKLVLPPGPNNPVGVAWIGLDKPGYGIHGTPNPEQVGRTESHGCFRLANWKPRRYLLHLVTIGTPVYVQP